MKSCCKDDKNVFHQEQSEVSLLYSTPRWSHLTDAAPVQRAAEEMGDIYLYSHISRAPHVNPGTEDVGISKT